MTKPRRRRACAVKQDCATSCSWRRRVRHGEVPITVADPSQYGPGTEGARSSGAVISNRARDAVIQTLSLYEQPDYSTRSSAQMPESRGTALQMAVTLRVACTGSRPCMRSLLASTRALESMHPGRTWWWIGEKVHRAVRGQEQGMTATTVGDLRDGPGVRGWRGVGPRRTRDPGERDGLCGLLWGSSAHRWWCGSPLGQYVVHGAPRTG